MKKMILILTIMTISSLFGAEKTFYCKTQVKGKTVDSIVVANNNSQAQMKMKKMFNTTMNVHCKQK